MRKTIFYLLFLSSICVIINACQNAQQLELAQYTTGGKDLYQLKCQNCHGQNGEGLGELAPPLTDTVFLKVNKSNLACIIKNGANKTMVINGKNYNGKMPAFKTLTDIDIAKIIVYVTNSFDNKQGLYTTIQVTKDLKNCK
jgi:mono/diheme cytochrome c family protein